MEPCPYCRRLFRRLDTHLNRKGECGLRHREEHGGTSDDESEQTEHSLPFLPASNDADRDNNEDPVIYNDDNNDTVSTTTSRITDDDTHSSSPDVNWNGLPPPTLHIVPQEITFFRNLDTNDEDDGGEEEEDQEEEEEEEDPYGEDNIGVTEAGESSPTSVPPPNLNEIHTLLHDRALAQTVDDFTNAAQQRGEHPAPPTNRLWSDPILSQFQTGDVVIDPQRFARIVLTSLLQELTPPPPVGFADKLLRILYDLCANHGFKPQIYPETQKTFNRWVDITTGRRPKCQAVQIPLESSTFLSMDQYSQRCQHRETAIVYKWDPAEQVRSLLSDETLFGDVANLVVNPDPEKRFEPYVPPNDRIGEICSAKWYATAQKAMHQRHWSRTDIPQEEKHPPFLIGVILGMDATATDRNQRFKSEPMMMTLALLDGKSRNKTKEAWRVLGLIPAMDKKSKNDRKRDAQGSKLIKAVKFGLNGRNHNRAIGAILATEFKELQEKGMILQLNLGGVKKIVHCYFPIAAVIGDILSNDMNTYRIISHHRNTARICWQCACEFSDLANHKKDCSGALLQADYKELVEGCEAITIYMPKEDRFIGGEATEGQKNRFRAIYRNNTLFEFYEKNQYNPIDEDYVEERRSRGLSPYVRPENIMTANRFKEYIKLLRLKGFQRVDPVLNTLDFGGNPHGQFTAFSLDILHSLLGGVIKNVCCCFISGLSSICKEQIDHVSTTMFLEVRSSEKSYGPRMSFAHGMTNLTEMTCREWVGVMFVLLVVIRTYEGQGIVDVFNANEQRKRKKLESALKVKKEQEVADKKKKKEDQTSKGELKSSETANKKRKGNKDSGQTDSNKKKKKQSAPTQNSGKNKKKKKQSVEDKGDDDASSVSADPLTDEECGGGDEYTVDYREVNENDPDAPADIQPQDFIETAEQILSFFVYMNSLTFWKKSENKVNARWFQQSCDKLLENIVTKCPRRKGNGHRSAKVHAMFKRSVHHIQQFGSLVHTSTEVVERGLIDWAKHTAVNTNRQSFERVYQGQALRIDERIAIREVFRIATMEDPHRYKMVALLASKNGVVSSHRTENAGATGDAVDVNQEEDVERQAQFPDLPPPPQSRELGVLSLSQPEPGKNHDERIGVVHRLPEWRHISAGLVGSNGLSLRNSPSYHIGWHKIAGGRQAIFRGHWKNSSRRVGHAEPNEIVVQAVNEYLYGSLPPDQATNLRISHIAEGFQINCHSEMFLKTGKRVRAHPNYNSEGKPWYDWILLKEDPYEGSCLLHSSDQRTNDGFIRPLPVPYREGDNERKYDLFLDPSRNSLVSGKRNKLVLDYDKYAEVRYMHLGLDQPSLSKRNAREKYLFSEDHKKKVEADERSRKNDLANIKRELAVDPNSSHYKDLNEMELYTKERKVMDNEESGKFPKCYKVSDLPVSHPSFQSDLQRRFGEKVVPAKLVGIFEHPSDSTLPEGERRLMGVVQPCRRRSIDNFYRSSALVDNWTMQYVRCESRSSDVYKAAYKVIDLKEDVVDRIWAMEEKPGLKMGINVDDYFDPVKTPTKLGLSKGKKFQQVCQEVATDSEYSVMILKSMELWGHEFTIEYGNTLS